MQLKDAAVAQLVGVLALIAVVKWLNPVTTDLAE